MKGDFDIHYVCKNCGRNWTAHIKKGKHVVNDYEQVISLKVCLPAIVGIGILTIILLSLFNHPIIGLIGAMAALGVAAIYMFGSGYAWNIYIDGIQSKITCDCGATDNFYITHRSSVGSETTNYNVEGD